MNLSNPSSTYKSIDTIFTVMASIAVAAGIVTGFHLLGSPNQQRLLSLDQGRINDLQQISGVIRREYGGVAGQATSPLPALLIDVGVNRNIITDPVTEEPYGYRVLSDSTYELCATFATHSPEPSVQNELQAEWVHPKGRHCYEFDVSKPNPKPSL